MGPARRGGDGGAGAGFGPAGRLAPAGSARGVRGRSGAGEVAAVRGLSGERQRGGERAQPAGGGAAQSYARGGPGTGVRNARFARFPSQRQEKAAGPQAPAAVLCYGGGDKG